MTAEMCYCEVMGHQGWTIGIVKAGQHGYYALDYEEVATVEEARRWAQSLNDRLGVTPNEIMRLVLGSMRRD